MRAIGSQAGRGWHLDISFNSSAAAVIARSPAATAWRFRRGRSSGAMQVTDADHVLERLNGAEGSFCLNAYPGRFVGGRVDCLVRCIQTHCIVRPGGSAGV